MQSDAAPFQSLVLGERGSDFRSAKRTLSVSHNLQWPLCLACRSACSSNGSAAHDAGYSTDYQTLYLCQDAVAYGKN